MQNIRLQPILTITACGTGHRRSQPGASSILLPLFEERVMKKRAYSVRRAFAEPRLSAGLNEAAIAEKSSPSN